MTNPNNSSLRCWNYEGTPNSAAITAAGSTSYLFGMTDDVPENWSPPSVEKNVKPYYSYSQRMPKGQTRLDPKYPEFIVPYRPINPQCFARFLGNPQSAAPATIDPLNSGITYPITYRMEQKGGTTEKLTQAVGCYTVGLNIIADLNEKVRVEEILAGGYLEDQGDRDILTTPPTQAGGLSAANGYVFPYIEWNSVEVTNSSRVIFTQKKKYSKDRDDSTGKYRVYPGKFEPAIIEMHFVMQDTVDFAMWNDFIDENTRNGILKFYKLDATYYWQIDLGSCDIIKFVETGIRHRDHFLAVATISCPDVSGSANILAEQPDNFSTHYKAAVS